MVPVIALWLVFSAGKPTRRTLAVGLLSLIVSLATIQVYVEWRHAASGLTGLTTNNNWNLYTRVAPWADCTKFTPPPGTRALCPTPAQIRVLYNNGEYIFSPESPAVALFGTSYRVSKYPHAMTLLRRWSEAAILGQPLDYLHAIWLDMIRLVDPNHQSYSYQSADEMIAFMLGGYPSNSGKNVYVESWQHRLYPGDPAPHRGDIGPLKEWERITRVDGAWMVILLILCLIGPWVLVGRARSGMVLFAATALALMFFPIFVAGYEYRYTIPAFAPLVAAGALAAWGLVVKIRPLVLRIAPKPGATPG
jgi:hypothetical protein